MVTTFLLIGAAALLLVMFTALTVLVFRGAPSVVAFDVIASEYVAPFKTPSGTAFFSVVTFFGSFSGIVLFALLTLASSKFDTYLIVRACIAVGGSALVVQGIKWLLARARPERLAWLGEEPQFSFPSGHSTAAVALYGFLIIFSMTTTVFPPMIQILLFLAVLVIILFVGVSRLALSVHYASDIIGGYLMGLLWLTLAFLAPLPF